MIPGLFLCATAGFDHRQKKAPEPSLRRPPFYATSDQSSSFRYFMIVFWNWRIWIS